MDSSKQKILGIFKKVKNQLTNFCIFCKISKKKNFSEKIKDQGELDKKLVASLSKSKLPNLRQLKYVNKFLNSKEVFTVKLFSAVILLSLSFLGWQFYKNHVIEAPAIGGEYFEGLVGVPRYINPLYSESSDADSDIGSLIFSSLFKRNKEGHLEKDIVDTYEVSEDGKNYTIKIKENIKWHNGTLLTSDDIVFTFNAIKDKQYNSTLRSSFLGVGIEKIDDLTIKFTLEEPYAVFFELLTFGILPEELWTQILPESANLAELNLKPIGSGPYKFKKLAKDRSGNIKMYELVANEKYYDGQPLIENITFKFFASFEEALEALNNNTIDGISYLPKHLKENLIAKESLNFYNLDLPQLTAIFFNKSKNKNLKDKNVRQALAFAINKEELSNNVFDSDIKLIDGPIPEGNFAYDEDLKKYNFSEEEAKKLLTSSKYALKEITEGMYNEALKNLEATTTSETIKKESTVIAEMGAGKWFQKNNEYLKIVITTVDSEDNSSVAKFIKKSWEKIGVKTILNIVPSTQIQSNVIQNRNFEALFYGQIIGHDPDNYAFWHSSQSGENGLNLSNYSNKKTDKLLEDARLTSNMDERKEKYKEFQEILAEEVPAIFMYSPTYSYAQSKKIKNFDVKKILVPNNRFSNITHWYIKTGKKISW